LGLNRVIYTKDLKYYVISYKNAFLGLFFEPRLFGVCDFQRQLDKKLHGLANHPIFGLLGV